MAKDAASAAPIAQLAIIGMYAMLMAYPLATLLNLFVGRKRWLLQAMKGDDLEQLLYNGLTRRVPICITTGDNKVYVGFVVGTPDPTKPRKTVSLLPLMSGYRDRETQRLNFITFYTEIYGTNRANPDDQLPAPLSHLQARDFVTLIPIEKMSSCRLFDLAAYEAFGTPRATHQVPDESADQSG